MGGDLGGHRQSLGLGPADHLDGDRGRQVQEVDAARGGPGQGDVPGHHHLLGCRGHARDAQSTRPGAFVHGPVARQRAVLAVLGQDDTQAPGVLEGPSHQPGRLDAGAVIGEEAHPEAGELGHRSQSLAEPPDGDGPGHRHLGGCRERKLLHVADGLGGVEGRIGVGHGHHSGVPTEGRRPGSGLDGLGLLAARLAQMGVQVDQPGCHDATLGLEHHRTPRALDPFLHRRHLPVGHEHVGPSLAGGVGDGAAPDHQGGPGRRRSAGALSHGGPLRPAPARAAGTARPSGWPRRC